VRVEALVEHFLPPVEQATHISEPVVLENPSWHVVCLVFEVQVAAPVPQAVHVTVGAVPVL